MIIMCFTTKPHSICWRIIFHKMQHIVCTLISKIVEVKIGFKSYQLLLLNNCSKSVLCIYILLYLIRSHLINCGTNIVIIFHLIFILLKVDSDLPVNLLKSLGDKYQYTSSIFGSIFFLRNIFAIYKCYKCVWYILLFPKCHPLLHS